MCSFPQNLAWIYVAVSGTPELTNGLRTDGGTYDSSSADKAKQS